MMQRHDFINLIRDDFIILERDDFKILQMQMEISNVSSIEKCDVFSWIVWLLRYRVFNFGMLSQAFYYDQIPQCLTRISLLRECSFISLQGGRSFLTRLHKKNNGPPFFLLQKILAPLFILVKNFGPPSPTTEGEKVPVCFCVKKPCLFVYKYQCSVYQMPTIKCEVNKQQHLIIKVIVYINMES